MKKIVILIVSALSFICHSEKMEKALESLSKVKGIARNEIYTFQVSYSDVKVIKKDLCFTVTMLHKEKMGTYTVIGKCKLPLKTLKDATRSVVITELGSNPTVSIKMKKGATPFQMDGEIETKDNKGKLVKPKETFEAPTNHFSFHFSTPKQAKNWNLELTKFLNNK